MIDKDIVQMVVREVQGGKGVEIATRCVRKMIENGVECPNVPELLSLMVANGELVEVEYVLPDHPHQVKSFYLPKSSRVMIVGKEVVKNG